MGDVVLHLYYTVPGRWQPTFEQAVAAGRTTTRSRRPPGTKAVQRAERLRRARRPTAAEPYPPTRLAGVPRDGGAGPPTRNCCRSSMQSRRSSRRGRAGGRSPVSSITVRRTCRSGTGGTSWWPRRRRCRPASRHHDPGPEWGRVRVGQSRTCPPTTINTAGEQRRPGDLELRSCRRASAADFRSLTKDEIGDVVLLVNWSVSPS